MMRKRSTRLDAVTLAKATVIKSALQLLTPLALVRLLDQLEFGEYRLFWLVANTAVLILAFGVHQSLLYFLPKSTVDERRRFVSQTLVYFLAVGLLAGLILLTGNTWLPDSVTSLTEPRYLLAGFIFLWISSTPIKMLPNADQNIVWQSRVIIIIAVLRALLVVGAAWFTGDIQTVFTALMIWAALHWVFLAYYVGTRYGLRLPLPTVTGFKRQLGYAVPFGLSRLLAGLRRQGEQWIVAYLFSTASLAVYSIGLSFNVVLSLVRSSLGNVILPKMSRSSANDDMSRSLELNSRGNIAVVMLAAPAVVYVCVFAESLVRLLYTETYIEAVPVVRVYMVTLLVMSVELTTVMMVMEQGRHVAKVNAMVLLAGLFISFVGGQLIGITGVALGALLGEFASRFMNYRHAARVLNIPARRLQDWRTLSKIGFAAAAAGAISSFVCAFLADYHDVVILAVGAATFGTVYLLAVGALKLSWVLKAMSDRGGWR